MSAFRDWRGEMIAALRSGRELTQSNRNKLADYLEWIARREPLPRKKGRPPRLVPSLAKEQLVWFVDNLVKIYAQQGDADPEQAAFDEVEYLEREEGRYVTQASLRRYHREGVQKLRETEARLATLVNEKVDELQRRGVPNPLAAALDALASDYATTPDVLSRRYDRGLKALARRKADLK